MNAWLDRRLADLRWAVRSIRRSPATSLLGVVSLALGIGANTAMFSSVNAMLLRRLPVPSPGELHLVVSDPADPRVAWNYPDYLAFRDRVRGFSGLAAASGVGTIGVQVTEHGSTGAAELVQRQFVSGNYFEVLGVGSAIGRLITPADGQAIGGAPVAVLAFDYWQGRFAGDAGVIGRTIRLNGYPLTVVGVASRGFGGIDPTARAAVFVPIAMHSEIQGVPVGVWNTRHYWWLRVIGRVPAGTATAPLEAQLTSVFKVEEEEERKANPRMGRVNRGQSVYLESASRGWSAARGTLQAPLVVLMAAVVGLLLIACANVANIMLARGAARQREIAIRLAVGAGRARVASQLLTESLVVACLGALAGVGLAWAGVGLALGRFLPTTSGREVTLDASPDLTVLAFTVGVSVLTGLLAGLAPAAQATRPSLAPALKEGTPGRSGRSRVLVRRSLVVVQVALSVLLLVGSALFVRSLANLRHVDAGFRRDHALVASVDPSRNGYKGQRFREFYERLRASIEPLPGVRSVSLASITPLGGMRWNGDFAVEGRPFKEGEPRYVDMNSVGPRYFETMGIPLIAGRDFREEDNPAVVEDPPNRIGGLGEAPEPPGPRVLIVSEGFARRFLGDGQPVGRRLSLTEAYEAARAYEVIGVARDARYFGLREAPEPMIYLPAWRRGILVKSLVVRTAGPSAGVVEAIREAVRTIDRAVPLLSARTIEEEVDSDIVRERLVATLAGVFGLLALLLASVGLYGVISFLVTRRTREIGVRLALGATRAGIVRLVLGDTARMVGIGAAVGVGGAIGLSRLVRSLLYGIAPHDPVTIAAGVAVLTAVAALAVAAPIRRAFRIHPSEALRDE